jgi:hypothetical protein
MFSAPENGFWKVLINKLPKVWSLIFIDLLTVAQALEVTDPLKELAFFDFRKLMFSYDQFRGALGLTFFFNLGPSFAQKESFHKKN